MINFYIVQIQLGNITLDDVPERFKELVAEQEDFKKAMDASGWNKVVD